MEAFLFLVGVLGLEPRMTGPESVVLPLHHTPIQGCKIKHLSICGCKGTTFSYVTKTFREFFIKKMKLRGIMHVFRSVCCTFVLCFIYKCLMDTLQQLVKSIILGIQEKKGSNIVVADLQKIEGSICKFFVVCQGNSPQQVEAIATSVGDYLRENEGEKPVNVVGLTNAQWVAMDYVDVMVHIFLPDVREYYDLENLWQDAELTRVPDLD